MGETSGMDAAPNVPWDSAAHGVVYDYPNVEAFIATPRIRSGVHRIGIPDSPPVEIFARGIDGLQGALGRLDARASARLGAHRGFLPCFFTAATTEREGTSGPYFTGLHIQLNPLAPMIAVADPLLAHDPDVRIGWYTGLPRTGAQAIIAKALAHISAAVRRPLLAVGGSGGGFAAILYASLLSEPVITGSQIAARSGAFVWNPQVSITDYTFVQPYLDVMFPENVGVHGTQAAKLLSASGVTHDLRELPLPRRLLYIQNQSDDDHIVNHAQPYREAYPFRELGEGLYAASPKQLMIVADYGDGHAPLPRPVMRLLLSTLKRGAPVPRNVKEMLEGAR